LEGPAPVSGRTHRRHRDSNQLGYDDGKLFRALRDEGFGVSEIYRTGLVGDGPEGPTDYFRGCVTIPYHVVNNVITVRGRVFNYEGKGPKYRTLAGAKSRLFNSDATWHAEDLYVCEGEFDTILMQQLGFNAVGVPGANTWQDAWDSYLSMVKRVYTVFDGDEAGQKGTERLKDRFGGKVRALHIPAEDGKVPDITDWVVIHGKGQADFQALTDEARSGGLLLSVDDAFKEHQEVQGAEGLKFGIDKLDLILRPGPLATCASADLRRAGPRRAGADGSAYWHCSGGHGHGSLRKQRLNVLRLGHQGGAG
jgi:hypothetical protein